jgi:hypothetical protein
VCDQPGNDFDAGSVKSCSQKAVQQKWTAGESKGEMQDQGPAIGNP